MIQIGGIGMFLLLYYIFALAAIVITLKVLFGYNPEISKRLKIFGASLIVFAWFSPVASFFIRKSGLLNETMQVILSKTFSCLFVSAFFLLCVILIRDTIWVYGYEIGKRVAKVPERLSYKNFLLFKKVNFVVVICALLLTSYSLYQGMKFPKVEKVEIVTPKVFTPFRIVALSDLHITPLTSLSFLERLVKTVEDLNPDAVVLVGDIIDAQAKEIEPQLSVLQRLNALYGVFVTLGNREFFYGSLDWEKQFNEMGFIYLANNGVILDGRKLYISGLPDPQLLKITPLAMHGIKEMLNEGKDNFRVFLSHSPRFINKLNKDLIDLQISGHTRGGQIFPLHFYVKKFNHYLAGLYDVEGMKLYVSKGIRTWGAPMRLFAPSEISVIDILPEQGQGAEVVEEDVIKEVFVEEDVIKEGLKGAN